MNEEIQNTHLGGIEPSPFLCVGRLLKSSKKGKGDDWSFRGIASDEKVDEEGDQLLKKSLDLSYAQQRGYVNWDHSREPKDQLGFLTKAAVIDGDLRKSLEDELGEDLSSTASVYMEGVLYPYMEKAQHAKDLMKSSKEVGGPGLGMSLDGAVARDKDSGGIVRAFVRGVALTTAPVNTRTLCQLRKSLASYSSGQENSGPEIATADEVREAAQEMASDRLHKAIEGSGMSFDEATLFLLKKRPHWTYDLATRVVKYTLRKN